ncbi:uncharacterized protein LOC123915300 [Trifolium pratense]|uniref:uncharacterized protein LOC123915300 n=1 Tax=Trifolium pratense TaxID=57577 RepID=UPI001E6921E5|nr:uncharacterized protein LOC123915300 [Trifolium pratense]
MNIVSWNCRGVGHPCVVPGLKYLVRVYKPDVLFLSETLSNTRRMEELRHLLGFDSCFGVNREGRGGGLAFMWRSSFHCSVTNFSSNHVDVEVADAVNGNWRLTGIYGFPGSGRRRDSWNFLKQLSQISSLPWCVFGDFNDILSSSEKKGRNDRAPWLINGFRSAVLESGLADVHMEGYPFTWFKSLGTFRAVEERLDRALANDAWFHKFPNAVLENLPAPASDHYPILLVREPEARTRRARSRFNKGTSKRNRRDYKSKFALSMSDLVFESNVNTSEKATEGESQKPKPVSEVVETIPPAGDPSEENLGSDAAKQDLNSMPVETEIEDTHTEVEPDIADKSPTLAEMEADAAKDVETTVTTSETSDEETEIADEGASADEEETQSEESNQDAMFSMQPDKCPGPDGFNPGFFQHFWHLCGQDIFDECCKWLTTGSFPSTLTLTNIALIPKGDSQVSMKDWRPISLCNVIYKLVAKVLANRLKPILSKCIYDNQSAFVPGRSILDNAMVAIEVVHYMKSKLRGKVGDIALKLDISKAYDRIDWDYLRGVMLKMGFCTQWLTWIMMCVETVDYSILVNDKVAGPITPSRGLRQGDPLSPYLFIICAEGLTTLIRQAEARGDIHGVKICRNAPIVSHLLFADDCFLFFRANINEAEAMKNILNTYDAASGQSINFQKSEIFCSRNVSGDIQNSVATCLGVHAVLGTGKYLGLPSMIGRSKKSIFSFIKDRVWKKINSWSSKTLSKAGREVLIKSWGHSGVRNKGIHWMSWEKLSMHKSDGGMGFKSLPAFNLAMLGKQGWRVMSNPNILISKIYKARYFPHCDFFDSKVGHNPSFVWRSICNSKFILKAGSRWRIGSGKDIPLLNENWLYDASAVSLQQTNVLLDARLTVADIIIQDEKCWNMPLITSIFEPNCVTKILDTPLYKSVVDDMRIWRVEKMQINEEDASLLACVIWSIWKHRNNIIWNNVTDAQNFVFSRANITLHDWRVVHTARTGVKNLQVRHESRWKKPSSGRMKCNIDASFSSLNNRVGIGVCIRDEFGAYVLAKYEQFTPLCDVRFGEALGLLSALNWVHELNLGPVDFELDSKIVVDSFHSNKCDATELGDIISHCKQLFSNYYNNSSVEFIRRQANEVAHSLAKAATYAASPRILVDIPNCIEHLLINEML